MNQAMVNMISVWVPALTFLVIDSEGYDETKLFLPKLLLVLVRYNSSRKPNGDIVLKNI